MTRSGVYGRVAVALDDLSRDFGAVRRDDCRRKLVAIDRKACGAEVGSRAVLGVEDDDRHFIFWCGGVGELPERLVDDLVGDLFAAIEAGADVDVDFIDGAAGDGIVGAVLEEERPGVAQQAAGRGRAVLVNAVRLAKEVRPGSERVVPLALEGPTIRRTVEVRS